MEWCTRIGEPNQPRPRVPRLSSGRSQSIRAFLTVCTLTREPKRGIMGAMRRLLLFCMAPSFLLADEWVKFTSGPFEVMTDAGERAGRETMVRFQEFRHALGLIAGENDLQTPQPVRIMVFKNAKGWT